MIKSSTYVTRKALKLDDKVKVINCCDGGKSCWAVGDEIDNEHSLKKTLDSQRF